jgi:DNA-binding NtrC family response regulator
MATTNRNLLKSVEKGEFREDLYYRLNVLPIHVPALRERPEDIPVLAEGFLNFFKRKYGLRLAGFTDAAMRAMLAHSWPGNVRELQNCVERAAILAADGGAIDAAELSLPASHRTGDHPTSVAVAASAPVAASASAIVSPAATAAPSAAGQPDVGDMVSLGDIERRHILEVLQRAGGNRSKAAQILDISVRTLRNKLQEYGAGSAAASSEGGEDSDEPQA